MSGCLSGQPPANQTPKPTQTSVTASETADAPTDVSASNTLNYSSLSAVEQTAFDAALTSEVAFAPASVRNSPYVNGTYAPTNATDVFKNHEYVRKNGSLYRLSWDTGPTLATYAIQTTEQQPAANDTTVALDTLPTDVQEPVRTAIENGSYGTPFGQWASLPDSLGGVDYIRANNAYYRISIVVGDFWAEKMSAQNVQKRTTS
ncbi:hypothetical protein [Halobacterium sp. CBA1132]|nr:hypothetical protein [Halobacterium sp. CBA1132]